MTSRCVYGPVPSRRLGRSLGVDLVPYKTCSYDCVYCQLGRTNHKTIERRAFVPVRRVLDQLADRLQTAPTPEFITLAGSGEPTLHAELGELIAGIKDLTRLPVAVLTNGSLLWMPDVRADLAQADLVMPSLDAGDSERFQRLNRPHPDLAFETMVEGLDQFSHEFAGSIRLEVLVVAGINDGAAAMENIAALARRLRHDGVQLGTVTRPPAERDAHAASAGRLDELRQQFFPTSEGVPSERPAAGAGSPFDDQQAAEEIWQLVGRRPCSVAGLALGLGLHRTEVLKLLDGLSRRGVVRAIHRGDEVLYGRADREAEVDAADGDATKASS